MDMNASLLHLARAILVGKREGGPIAATLASLVEITGACRGFFFATAPDALREVARSAADDETSPLARPSTRLLVERAAKEGRLVTATQGARGDAPGRQGLVALALPFCDGENVVAVAYLDTAGAFGEGVEELLQEALSLAAPSIRDAVASDRPPPHDRQGAVLSERSFAAADPGTAEASEFEGIVTAHPEMRTLIELVRRVAPSRAPVLILGPTGTGKELLAKAVHQRSDRRSGPFVTVHCSAIPASLLEAELFGHVAGAYTGAHRDRPGRIAGAHGGTLFFDEIGEIPPDFQAKLLRFLQFGEIQRVGSDRVDRVDVRIVSATHRNLRELSQEGKFREDLFYRINAVTMSVPPLSARRSDIPLLVRHVLSRCDGGQPGARFSERAAALLAAYDYPGNVRELIHIVERARILERGPVIDVDVLPDEVVASAMRGTTEPTPTSASLETARAEAIAVAEREFLRTLMRNSHGNISRAARDAGMHRSYLQKLLARHRTRLDKSGHS